MKKLIVLTATFLSAWTLGFSAQAADPKVEIKTNLGNIVLELNQEKAPKTVDNFLQYVKSGAYNGTIFHRVIDGFMIQGGGYDADMKQKPVRAPIKNEATNGLKNERGTVAMARTGDPHSATAQFFINVADNVFLNHVSPEQNWGYAVFAKVVDGIDVVDKIKSVKTGDKAYMQNVPLEPVVIQSVKLLPEAKPAK